MESQISNMVESYEHGRMNRRQLIVRLGALFATASVASSQVVQTAAGTSTFKAVGLNHIALRVTDVERSRDFYVKHLGLEVSRESLPGNCFMNVGDNFVALTISRQRPPSCAPRGSNRASRPAGFTFPTPTA